MRYIKASPSEFLVVSTRGRVVNHGLAAAALVWPGSSFVLVPSVNQEATFEMTQETADGIPLRFKGIVLYHVEDPVAASRTFDFTSGAGRERIQTLLAHVCLGELRSVVARLTMKQCIEERKTTLTDTVAKVLAETIAGGHGWGIALDVVQVAQVFIVDAELRRQLEAELRTTIKAASELAGLEATERVTNAQLAASRRARAEQLETTRQSSAIQAEEARLAATLEQDRLAAAEPAQLAALVSRRRLAQERLALLREEREVRALEVEIALAERRADQALKAQILPLEQAPEVARALAGILEGARLTVIGGETSPLATQLAPLAEYLATLMPAGKRE